MTSDLTNSTGGNLCPGNGITIDANNITLDCQGHKLTGDNTGSGIFSNGILRNTIKNCIVTNFHGGIRLYYSSNSTLTNNTANSNVDEGIGLYYSSNSTLTNNTANSNYYGIALSNCSNSTLTNNTLNSNGYHGIDLSFYSDNDTINENVVCNNSVLDFSIQLSAGNSGDNNKCDKPDGWNDNGKTGCTYSCVVGIVGDINGDCVVDIFDAIILANNYNKHTSAGDLNKDGIVDIFDAILLSNNYNKRC
jgi:parallel beta-helix repeat protein